MRVGLCEGFACLSMKLVLLANGNRCEGWVQYFFSSGKALYPFKVLHCPKSDVFWKRISICSMCVIRWSKGGWTILIRTNKNFVFIKKRKWEIGKTGIEGDQSTKWERQSSQAASAAAFFWPHSSSKYQNCWSGGRNPFFSLSPTPLTDDSSPRAFCGDHSQWSLFNWCEQQCNCCYPTETMTNWPCGLRSAYHPHTTNTARLCMFSYSTIAIFGCAK
jgi:hypothetical protein